MQATLLILILAVAAGIAAVVVAALSDRARSRDK
jgi:hypothetical protein